MLHRLRYKLANVEKVAAEKRRGFVLDLLPPDSVGVEVGVWEGDFSAQLLYHVRPKRLHLVDPWTFQPDIDAKAKYGGGFAASQEDMDALYGGVVRRFRHLPVTVHRATSVEAAAKFKNESVDWVYIDGVHLHEYVLADLRSWWPKLRYSGLLIADDYVEGGWWEGGVIRAVDDFVDEVRCAVVEKGRGGQFIAKKVEAEI